MVVLGGGPYANTSPEKAMADPNVDAICIAEGEHVMRELLQVLLRGEGTAGLQQVQGIHTRAPVSFQVVQTPTMPMLEELDSLPFPDYGEIDLSLYARHHAATCVLRPYAVIMASRGCPYSCTFCHNLWRKTKIRYVPEAWVIEEIDRLKKEHGVSAVWFMDDHIFLNKKRSRKIFQEIIDNKFNIVWASANTSY